MPAPLVDPGRLPSRSASELSQRSSEPQRAGLGEAAVPKPNGCFDAAKVDRGQGGHGGVDM
jgi:hypothetical protein